MRALLVLLLASPAAAQDGPLPFDPAPVTACLASDVDPDSCAGRAAALCMEAPGGATTVGMGYCLDQERDFWDKRLNTTYGAVMDQARAADAEAAEAGLSAPEQAAALREMQRRWIAFRDAACTFEAARWTGGTGAGPAATQCMLTLTARQAVWLDGYLHEGR